MTAVSCSGDLQGRGELVILRGKMGVGREGTCVCRRRKGSSTSKEGSQSQESEMALVSGGALHAMTRNLGLTEDSRESLNHLRQESVQITSILSKDHCKGTLQKSP